MINEDAVKSMKQRFQIVGDAPELLRAIDTAIQVAPTNLSVLVNGESGTGKEVISKIVHANSLRRNKVMIAVNCGAIPEGTIDSELFGHEKGAFTGAINEHKGYFAEANGSTIFLDEVAELPPSTQARLLRVLESGEYMKVGSSKVEKTDVRIVAATNVDLLDAVRQGKFREDLYYRLCAIPIKMPPLRERGRDIEKLFLRVSMDCAKEYNMPPLKITEGAREKLVSYHWPGNVRQLQNMVRRLIVTVREPRLVTEEMLDELLPDAHTRMLPVLLNGGGKSEHTFENEREILYTVLFDMRRDITALKEQMNTLSEKAQKTSQSNTVEPVVELTNHNFSTLMTQTQTTVKPQRVVSHGMVNEIQDTEVLEEEILTIRQRNKELIRKALQKNGGNRKSAAAELGISERTLYRKIKEYGLDAD